MLIERFGAILRETEGVGDFDVHIAEAQRIYPEIWRHLDEAREALHALARDTSTYDEMRKQELAHLGITDVDVSTTVDFAALAFGALRTVQVKTVTFNAAGYQRAREACSELMSTLPEVDWAAVAKAEDREIAAAGSMHAANWRKLAIGVVVAAGLIGISAALYSFFMNREEPLPAPSLTRQAKEDDDAAKRLALAAEMAHIDKVRLVYERTCDVGAGKRLAMLLEEAGQVTAASKIDTDACVAKRPLCDGVKDVIVARLTREHGLVEPEARCLGMMLPRETPHGPLRPAFAVEIEATGKKVMRAIVGEDGATDYVPAFVASGRLLTIADLDASGDDEVIVAGATGVGVLRVEDGAFTTVDMLPLTNGCESQVLVEQDFRNGRKGERRFLVLTAAEGQKKHCPAPGRYFYGLASDKLVLVE